MQVDTLLTATLRTPIRAGEISKTITVSRGHMEKQEMEVEWKLETEMEMRQSLARVLRMRKVGIAQDTAYRVEMVLCAAMEEGTEGFVVITCVLL